MNESAEARRNEELEDMKSIIRAILISAPHGQTFSELHKSYGELLHVPPQIPFRDIGFDSEVDFFETFPDVGKLVFLNGIYLVYGQATKKDEQIAKLVRGQRTKRIEIEKRIKQEDTVVKANEKYEETLDGIFETLERKKVRLTCIVEEIYESTFAYQCKLKKSFVSAIRDMLADRGQNDLMLRDFEEAFRIKFKRNLKLETHRVTSTLALCLKMPEIMYLYRKRGDIYIKSLFTRSKEEKRKGFFKRRSIQETPVDADSSYYRRNVIKDEDDKLTSVPSLSFSSLNDLTSYETEDNSSFEFSLKSSMDESDQRESMSEVSIKSSKSESDYVAEQTKPIDDQLKENLINVVKTTSKLGYLTVSEFCSAYEDIYKEKLNFESYGCLSFRELLKKAGNAVIIMTDTNDGGEKICLNQQTQIENPMRQLKRVVCSISRCLPSDVPPLGACYRCIKAPTASKEESIYVEVSMVLNPSHFWLQIWGKRTTGALKVLMDDLEMFYTNESNKQNYQMKNEDIVTGRCCIAYHGGDWQRATIIDVKSTRDVLVYFVDYGETSSVNIENVCHISMKFMHLQAQALRARLFGIRGKEGQWSAESSDIFLTYVQNRVVSCGVRYVNDNNVIYCVIGDEKQLPVTDLLLEKQLAEISHKRMFDRGISETYFGAVEVIEHPEKTSIHNSNYIVEIRELEIGSFTLNVLITALLDAELTSYVSEKEIRKIVPEEKISTRKLRKNFENRTLVTTVDQHAKMLEKIGARTGDTSEENYFYKLKDLPKIFALMEVDRCLVSQTLVAYKTLHDRLFEDIDGYVKVVKERQEILSQTVKSNLDRNKEKIEMEILEIDNCLVGFEQMLSTEYTKKIINENVKCPKPEAKIKEIKDDESDIIELDSTTEIKLDNYKDNSISNEVRYMYQRGNTYTHRIFNPMQNANILMNHYAQTYAGVPLQMQNSNWNRPLRSALLPFSIPVYPRYTPAMHFAYY